jgi:hypothetical protein
MAVIAERVIIVILNSLIAIIIIGVITVSIYYFVDITTIVFTAILIETAITFVNIYAMEDASNTGINQVETVSYT